MKLVGICPKCGASKQLGGWEIGDPLPGRALCQCESSIPCPGAERKEGRVSDVPSDASTGSR